MDVAPHIDGVVRAFAEFLRDCAPIVDPLAKHSGDPSYWSDWVQGNWEALVEAMLPRTLAARLEPYGDGAACNGHRRIRASHLAATHIITCRPRGDLLLRDLLHGHVIQRTTPLVFDRFVALDGRRAVEASPFDCVHVHAPGGVGMVLPIDGVRFGLSRAGSTSEHHPTP
jgi:hypothetical protein